MAWGEAGYVIEDRFRGLYGPSSGAMDFPGTRVHRVTPSDATDGSGTLPFRCRYFNASQEGELHVLTADGVDAVIYVQRGRNRERIDQVFATGGTDSAIVVEIWD